MTYLFIILEFAYANITVILNDPLSFYFSIKQIRYEVPFFFQNGGRLHGPLQGVPMVASSPVRHESPMQVNPVEVQSYQPPWQALSDFAMKNDMEQPPFQQLVSSFVYDVTHDDDDDDDHVVCYDQC